MKRLTRDVAAAFCLATLLLCTILLMQSSCFAAGTPGLSQTEQKVDRTLASLSDEQVRQMLIAELKKDAAAEEPDYDRMKGPAYILSRMLNGLSNEHDENEDELKALFNGIPQVLPDLYRVFIKL